VRDTVQYQTADEVDDQAVDVLRQEVDGDPEGAEPLCALQVEAQPEGGAGEGRVAGCE
jgi:hypothetical protein